MQGQTRHKAHPKIVAILCLFVFSFILVAGLWPFHAPKNDVVWLERGVGLRFGRYGSILSSHIFQTNSDGNTTGSIEVWLVPDLRGGDRTILSFDDSPHPGVPFSLHQDNDVLVVIQHNEDSGGTSRTAFLPVNGVFRGKRAVFVTVTLGPRETLVYVDGVRFKGQSIHGASTKNLSGRLVLAKSPGVGLNWSGEIHGLAIYDRQLTPFQVAQHYESWTMQERPTLTPDEAAVALYLFNERAGDIAHNQLDPSTDLIIPKRYFVLDSAFLASPWREYQPTWSYWEGFGVNVAGFIPLGFCLVAYLSLVRAVKRAGAITIFLGLVTSLTIETLQAFLPTRDSGMTDLITNTAGTAIGVILYQFAVSQGLLTKAERNGTSTILPTEAIRNLGTISADALRTRTSVEV